MPKKGAEPKTRTRTIRASADLARRLKIVAAVQERPLTALVDEALADWLKRNDKPQRPA